MSRFHEEMAAVLNDYHLTRGQYTNWQAPRGSSKSTWSTQSYPMFAALNGFEKFIIICADMSEQSDKYISAIRDELESNEEIRTKYRSAIEGMRCKEGSILLGNGCLIEGSATRKRVRGRKNGEHRPSLIIGDDLNSLEDMTSEKMRSRAWNWFTRDLIPAGDDKTNIIVLGTPIHREAICHRLLTTSGWKSRVYKAIEQWPINMMLWRQFEDILHDWDLTDREEQADAFYYANKAEMDA